MRPDTASLWEEVYPELSEGKLGLYGAVTGRSEAQVIRLALIYALLDEKNQIGIKHLRAALAIWDYADESARYVFGDATGDPIKDTIVTALRGDSDGLTRTNISRLFNRHVTADRIGIALDSLRKAGLAFAEKSETEGRPVEVWKHK